MRHSILGLALAGANLLTVGTALAQSASMPAPANRGSGYGYTPPAGMPITPHGQGGTGAIPPVERQIQAAKSVQQDQAARETSVLLRQADQALKQRQVAKANELLERAQTTLLNRPQGDGAASSDLASEIGDAQQFVVADNMSEAHQRIADVLGMMPAGPEAPNRAAPARHRQHR